MIVYVFRHYQMSCLTVFCLLHIAISDTISAKGRINVGHHWYLISNPVSFRFLLSQPLLLRVNEIFVYIPPQAKFDQQTQMPYEIVSKIHLVDLAGRYTTQAVSLSLVILTLQHIHQVRIQLFLFSGSKIFTFCPNNIFSWGTTVD